MQDQLSLLQKAKEARLNAYAPYSKFLVGACIESKSGKIFTGCNVENASYSVARCAESNAIGAMIANGEKEISQIVIVVQGPKLAAPCGSCRQQMNEFAKPDTKIHLYDLHDNYKVYSLSELLPYAFGPKDLI